MVKLKLLAKKVGTWIISPLGATLLIGLILVTISIISTYFVRAYNSDDVIWQNALLTWSPFNGHIFFADLGVSYVLKLPIYWAVSLFFEPGRFALLVTGVILAVANFYIVYRCYLYFLSVAKIKITRISLLPLLWLASFGFALAQQFVSTNLHNLEIGGIFIFLVLVSKLLRGEFGKYKTLTQYIIFGAIGLLAGAMILNDRYFIYFGILPSIFIGILFLVRKEMSKDRILTLATLILSSFVFYVLLKYIAQHFLGMLFMSEGVAGAGTPSIVSFDLFFPGILVTLHSLLILFGADIFQRHVTDFMTIVTFVNLALLAFGSFWLVRVFRDIRKSQSLQKIVLQLMGTIIVLALLIYTLSTLSLGNSSTYRYLLIVPYALVFILAYGLTQTRYRKVVVTLLLIGALLNTISSIGGIHDKALINIPPSLNNSLEDQQKPNYELIDVLESHGLTKGYVDYWEGNVNAYLSKGELTLLPVQCIKDKTQKYEWLIDDALFTKPAAKTFFLQDPAYIGEGALCSDAAIFKQFGTPDQTVDYKSLRIHIYNHDITSSL